MDYIKAPAMRRTVVPRSFQVALISIELATWVARLKKSSIYIDIYGEREREGDFQGVSLTDCNDRNLDMIHECITAAAHCMSKWTGRVQAARFIACHCVCENLMCLTWKEKHHHQVL